MTCGTISTLNLNMQPLWPYTCQNIIIFCWQDHNATCTTYSKSWLVIWCHMMFANMLIMSHIVSWTLVNKKLNYSQIVIDKKLNYNQNLVEKSKIIVQI